MKSFRYLLYFALFAATTAYAEVSTVVPLKAQPFPLSQVRLLDGPFRDAMLRDQHYLMSLDPNRLLRNFLVNVGLPTDAKPYGGWEAPTCELRGHSVGHYLSACSLMYASTGDQALKQRVAYMVGELAKCQAASPAAGFHTGYLSAFPESFFDRLEAGKRVWAPWYTIHKIMAGLLDAYQECGNTQALDVLKKEAAWVKFREDRLTPQHMQRTLNVEQGGMTEVLANLYAVTGNKDDLQLSQKFNHQQVVGPLEAGKDELNGLHANTQIPKIVGITREYEYTGKKTYLTAAQTFWRAVAQHRSYVIGGDSDREHFFPVTLFNQHLSQDTCETCNTYNMLKLTHDLFAVEPSAELMDFYERGLYNDILASQDPQTDMFTYFMSLKPGHFKVYSTPENSFWCCVGTGMENHAKYGNSIYYHNADSLYVNLFIASKLDWAEKGVSVQQNTQFPDSDTTTLHINPAKPVAFALKIRHPAWAVDGVKVWINGQSQAIESKPASYFSLNRTWHPGDVVKIQMPMRLHTEILPNDKSMVAILYGPIVLAGELGTQGMPNPLVRNQGDLNHISDPAVPVFVCDADTLLQHIHPVAHEPLTFQTQGLGRPHDVTLVPFYTIHRQRYSVYWNVLTASSWQARQARMAAVKAQQIALEKRTVDLVRPGEQQSEIDHKLKGERTDAGRAFGHGYRDAKPGGWFSYEVKVDPTVKNELVCTWWGGDAGARSFDILVDNQKIASQTLSRNHPGQFWDVTYPIPLALTQGKATVVIKWQGHPGNLAGGLFGCRVLRGETMMSDNGLPMAQQPAPVRVEDGLVQGTTEGGLTVYKGIPFAAPPVGDLRWRAPQPAAKWQGVRQATRFAPGPIQGGNPPSGKSEDCLYLNVWTPAKSAHDRIPVLVWIYGGGFNAGATSEPTYSGEKLAKKGVVLVSIAYRVGQLGFLAHPELSAESPHHVSGNYGLLDMIAGLQWVQKNIAAFGGDPHKVTIFGESAGGIAVSMLCASPLAKGLFQGAISESGGSFGPSRPTTYPGENMKSLAEAQRDGQAYVKRAGVSSIAELRKIPADKLPASGFGAGMAWPIIDGWVIPDDQYKLYAADRYNDTPILVGYNSDEGASFMHIRDPKAYIASVRKRYGPFADRLLKAYPVGPNSVPKTARDLMRDAAFGWHTWTWARLQAKTGKSKVFYYYFDQHPDYPKGSPMAGYGSPHGMEVPYVFEHLNASNPSTTKADLKISEAMATYWTNFAKFGNPNGKGVPQWPAFSDANPVVMVFSQTPHTGPVPSIQGLKSLDAYFAWRRTPEGKAWAK